MDKDGYPDDEELNKISNWDAKDFIGLMEYIYDLWKYSDCGYWEKEELLDGNTYKISTGGWSGNEDIIEALIRNHLFWMLYWRQSKRGGHYIFSSVKEYSI
jgi:hypothetical protein